MKKSLILLALLSIAPFIYSSQDLNSTLSNILYQDSATRDWVIKIEGLKVSQKYLDASFAIYQKQMAGQVNTNDMKKLKKAFLETFIQQNTITKKALEQQIFKDPAIQEQLRIMLMQNIYQIYLNHELESRNPDLEPNSEEINKFYQANQQQLRAYGLTAQQMQQQIKLELSKQKLGLWVNDFVNKTKESYRIERNSKLLKKMGFEE